jgi:hypothetical protein
LKVMRDFDWEHKVDLMVEYYRSAMISPNLG